MVKQTSMNTIILASDLIFNQIAFIFDADTGYVKKLFAYELIDIPDANIFHIVQLHKNVRLSDILDQPALARCADGIFTGCCDDEILKEMHASFLQKIKNVYGDEEKYGNEIRKRCGYNDILDYLSDSLSDLQTDLDGVQEDSDISSSSEEEPVKKTEAKPKAKPGKVRGKTCL